MPLARRALRALAARVLVVRGAAGACALVAALAVLGVPAVPASASTPAAHGLGARRPGAVVAPRVLALDAPPASVDLRRWAVPPGDQGMVSSCVAWAIDYGMLGWYSRYEGRAGEPFAPMYTYSQIDGGVDAGSVPADALAVASHQGNATRAHYPQGDYDWRDQPTAAERADAARYRIKGWETLFAGAGQPGAAAQLQHALATRHPVAITIAVRHGFDVLGPDAAAVDDDVSSPVRGYHEVLALGYDGAGLVVENSWGAAWGDSGFGRISWRVVGHDVWEADTIDGFAPPTPPAVTAPSVVAVRAAGHPAPPAVPASYRVAWKGSAGTSGAITRYDAWYEYGAAPFVPFPLAPGATSFTFTPAPGKRFRVAVRARAGSVLGAVRVSAYLTAPKR